MKSLERRPARRPISWGGFVWQLAHWALGLRHSVRQAFYLAADQAAGGGQWRRRCLLSGVRATEWVARTKSFPWAQVWVGHGVLPIRGLQTEGNQTKPLLRTQSDSGVSHTGSQHQVVLVGARGLLLLSSAPDFGGGELLYLLPNQSDTQVVIWHLRRLQRNMCSAQISILHARR
jgi:hypothetical protein